MSGAKPLPASKKKIALKILEVIVLILAGGFIIHFLAQSWLSVKDHLVNLNWWLLLGAWILFLVYFGSRALAWQLILKSLKVNLPFKETSFIWFLSEFSRFIPGNIWSFVGRVHLQYEKGVERVTTSLALLLEILFLVGATALFAAVFVWLWPYSHQSDFRWLFILAIPILILLLTPKVLEQSLNWVLKRLKKPLLSAPIARADLLKIFAVFTLGWLAYGVGSLLTMKAILSVSSLSPIWLIAGFVVAWLVGYLSFVTPMGLGVREGIIIAMLSPFVGAGSASLAAIATRLWLTLSELSIMTVIGVQALVKNWSKEEKTFKDWFIKTWPEVFLTVFIVLFVVTMCYYSFLKQTHYLTSLFDIGIMDQVVWNTAHGRIFELTQIFGTQTVSRFTIHADPLMVLLAPLYWIIASPYVLMGSQVIIVALGAIPLYKLASQVLNSRPMALLIAFVYLMYPALQRAAIYDFHPVTLTTSLFIAAFYFLFNKKYGWYTLCAFLALFGKETTSLSLAMIGLYIIIAQRNWKVGLSTIIVSLGWFYLLLWHIMPELRGGGPTNASSFLGRYSQFGKTPSGIIINVISKPASWIHYIINNHRFTYFLWLLLPVAFLALLSPIILLGIPEILINILSNYSPMSSIYYQYSSVITAFVFVAVIFGVRNIISWIIYAINKYRLALNLQQIQFGLATFILLCLAVSTWHYSLLPGMGGSDNYITQSKTPVFAPLVDQLSQTIPNSASVSATLSIEPHFSERQNIYSYPTGVGLADYLIIRTDDPFQVISQSYINQTVSSQYHLINQSGSLLVYQKN